MKKCHDKWDDNSDGLKHYPCCFLQGTLVFTDSGLEPVENIKVGTKVLTMDNGFQPVVKVHEDVWTRKDHERVPDEYRPILIRKDGMDHAVALSCQHRVHTYTTAMDMAHSEPEFLVAAKYLSTSVAWANPLWVTENTLHYYNFELENHEVMCASGLWVETYFNKERHTSCRPTAKRADAILIVKELEQTN